MKGFLSGVLLLLSLLVVPVAHSQTVTGTVTNSEGQAAAGATVFVAQTSVVGKTDAMGSFALPLPPSGSFRLVAVSEDGSLGTATITPETTDPAVITMEPKPESKAPAESALSEKDLLEFFTSTAFSWTKNSGEIVIENPESLVLSHDATNNVITASSTEPFRFTNNALGYRVTIYDLNLGGNQVAFGWSGHALFEPMTSERSKDEKNWAKTREKTYEGSRRHFLKALVDNRLKKEEWAAFFVEGPGSQSDHSPIFEAELKSVYGAPQPILFDGKIGDSKRLDFIGWVRVQYFGSGGDSRWERYIDRYWPVSQMAEVMKMSMNVSFIQLPDYQAILDPNGTLWPAAKQPIQSMGYWSFFRFADMLPDDWMPEE